MDKNLFDQAIGEPPPSTVDVDDIVASQRRVAWLRRAANPWSVAAGAVVAVTFAAVLVGSGDPGGTIAVAGDPKVPAVPSAAPNLEVSNCLARTPGGPPVTLRPEELAARLTGVLKAAVQPELVAGTALVNNPEGEYPAGTAHEPLQFFHVYSQVQDHSDGVCSGGEDYYLARATTDVGGKRGNIGAVVGRIGSNVSAATDCTDSLPQRTRCDRTTGPHGETVVAMTLSLAHGVESYRVNVTKPDGTSVIMDAENVAVSAKSAVGADSPAPPLDHDQLTGIALGLGLSP